MKLHSKQHQNLPDDYGVLEAYINKNNNFKQHNVRKIQRTLRRFAN